MQETRQNKIARLLQKELSVIFQEQTRSMHGVMVSVTQVRVSPDLGVCTAHLSIFPSEKAGKVMAILEENVKGYRGELGRKVGKQLRIVPEIVFYLDTSLDYAEDIEGLLKK